VTLARTSAERELHDLVSTFDQTRIKGQVAHDGFQWEFIRPLPPPPPLSPSVR